MGVAYKIRLEARKRRARRLGNCFYHSTNEGQTVSLPFAKPILDAIEANKQEEQNNSGE